ncbi:MAG: T9SS type A sorting domain-containing protein [Ignavibacteria bacterium]|nr:T9SS type A sorting domain-containing protein [Ignavibacteria bacterium]
MKKLVLLALLFIFYTNNSFSQNYNWITPNKTYLKMYVADDGMYRLNKTDFENSGISTNSIDPRTVKVFSKGNQIPVFFSGEQDGNFGASDYLDFYGTRNYGGITTTYDHNNFVAYTTNEYYNPYSDTNVYWVEWGGSNGLRFTTSSYSTVNTYSNLYFNDLIHFEKDNFYTQGELLNTSDLRFLSTEKFRGEGWYWVTLADNQTLSDTFSLPFLYTTPQNGSIRVFAYPTNRSTSILNEHTLQIRVNGNLVNTLVSNDMNKIDTTITFSSSLLSNSSVNNVSIKYVPAGGYSGSMYLDLFEVQYPRIFKFNSPKLSANLAGADTTSKLFRVKGYNSSNPVNIYDVNNNIKVTNVTSNLDTLKFTGKSNAKFELINTDITKKPLRIKQKQVPDLVSASNGADYLIIYHNTFTSQAEQLRAYRQTKDNFRSVKAEIEDIYDIFNFGIESPLAVRNFTNHIYNNWQLPKLGYICLLGRASLDPKKINSASAYYQNLIPTYGYPPSDGYFANFKIGTFCYYNQIAIGRLPAYYPSEAQSMIDKIVGYESQSPDEWSKDYVFITGGGTLAEQNMHQIKSNFEIGAYINQAPLAGDAHKIYRSDTSGSATFNLKDSVKNDLSRGCLYVNYRGHAGSHDWEVAMTDPNTLSNGFKLPLVLSLTCFTGENSKSDYRGFGERFIYLPDKGAIGFVGTTGWSYSDAGNTYGTHFLQTMKTDSARRIGNLSKYAQTIMSRDSLSFAIRHTLNCYSLIGDPAVTLNFPKIPELSITNNDYKLSNSFPNIGDNITFTAYPKNFGTYCDSTKIRLQIKKNNQNYLSKDTVLKILKFADSVSFNFKLDSLGIYTASITLDYNNWIPLENKSNNVVNINIPVKNTAFVPLKPVSNSVISSDSVEFSALNPRVDYMTNNVKVIIQFDTTVLFNSPVNRTFVNNNISGVVTRFKTSVPLLTNNKLYFWRTNCILNNDSSGWSSVQNFIYNNTLSSSAESSKENTEDKVSGESITILKNNQKQYSQSDYSGTYYKSNGAALSDYPATLYARSLGSNAEESSFFSVGNKNIYIDGGLNTGLNMLKVKKIDGTIVTLKNLKFTGGTQSSDSLVTFLNTFDTTHYLMLINSAYVPGAGQLSANAKTKLKQFGSIYCDSIGLLGYFHTWSLIGFVGANHSQVSEMFDPCCRPAPACNSCDHWTESVSSMDVTFTRTSGTVSNIIGPAQSWTDFSWTQTLSPGSTIKFDVYGIDINNQQALLMTNLQSNNFSDLSSINAYQYPKLNLLAKISIDTAAGKFSSVLNSVKVNYTAPSEVTWDMSTLRVSSSFIYGEDVKVAFNYHNPGYYNIPGVIINFYKKGISESNLIVSDTASYSLKADSLKKYSVKFPVPYFRDSMRVIAEIKPKGQNSEFHTYNNYIEFSMSAARIYTPVNVQVYSDNQLLSSGDFVTPHPEIKVNVSNPEITSSLISDTTKLLINLNSKYVPYFVSGKLNSKFKVIDNDNINPEGEKTILYYPELINGTNKLLVIYSNGDNSDTISYDVIVSGELAVKDLYNYPNPMKEGTSFIFNIAGSYAPTKFKIKIYTVSGRLIKQIESAVNIGNNQIPWDGRDEDGDIISNGTYLYKLVTEDESQTITQTQKLVVLR